MLFTWLTINCSFIVRLNSTAFASHFIAIFWCIINRKLKFLAEKNFSLGELTFTFMCCADNCTDRSTEKKILTKADIILNSTCGTCDFSLTLRITLQKGKSGGVKQWEMKRACLLRTKFIQ